MPLEAVMTRRATLWLLLPVRVAADMNPGDMADTYFHSMSSPNTLGACEHGQVQECCPHSQCIPGLEMLSGCDQARGQTTCVASKVSEAWLLKNGICRCETGLSCATGRCATSNSTLKPLPPIHPHTLALFEKQQVSWYWNAAAVNLSLVVAGLFAFMLVAGLSLRWTLRAVLRAEDPRPETSESRRLVCDEVVEADLEAEDDAHFTELRHLVNR
mmetsp:Transcript_89399/g.124156  ORF Transcript_89399/g.124156 Transcript_89399/m.124156 type:complete len:215 (+) Transcript_89399:17-661(+)